MIGRLINNLSNLYFSQNTQVFIMKASRTKLDWTGHVQGLFYIEYDTSISF